MRELESRVIHTCPGDLSPTHDSCALMVLCPLVSLEYPLRSRRNPEKRDKNNNGF